ncbi:hypothetical protein M1K46_07945 [Fictibacillus sp. WQ 8-8]|uniref:hypothetical protein n=1 Tax=Fictibacillus sp. WQ 8-8 TaxID=2938788 RepID=UPI00210DEA24|nr:hypothetical protein [Fictibacillus sp. WQ 8-8]MCQ6265594.1 hypothetical protein [Fictibacillus sp. WQ 8-8]
MFGLNIKSVIKYGLILLLFPVVINFTVFSAKLPWVFGNEDNWLSFWGNYTGGVISAIVAFFVASSQINKQLQNDLHKEERARIINQLPALVRIKIELELIITTLKFATVTKRKLEKHNANSVAKYTAQSIDEDNWIYLDRIVDIDMQTNLIKCKSFYKDFSSALTFPYDLKRARLMESSDNSPSEYAQWVALEEEIEGMKLTLDFGFYKLENNYIEELEGLLKAINREIERAKKLQLPQNKTMEQNEL